MRLGKLSVENQMELSAALGIPMVDLIDKTEDFVNKVHALVRRETAGPRVAVVMMAVAYLYHVSLAVEKGSDILEEAAKALLVATELMTQSMEQSQ